MCHHAFARSPFQLKRLVLLLLETSYRQGNKLKNRHMFQGPFYVERK